MRSLVGQLLVPVLAALLVVTTPVGTGQGVHANELLHPVLPHVHVVDGRILTDEQLAARRAIAAGDSMTTTAQGPTLGAGNGADAPGLALGLEPIVPDTELLRASARPDRMSLADVVLPTEFRDPPQDPPPIPLA